MLYIVAETFEEAVSAVYITKYKNNFFIFIFSLFYEYALSKINHVATVNTAVYCSFSNVLYTFYMYERVSENNTESPRILVGKSDITAYSEDKNK